MDIHSLGKNFARVCLTIAAIRVAVMAMTGWFMDICLMDLLLLETTLMEKLLSPTGPY